MRCIATLLQDTQSEKFQSDAMLNAHGSRMTKTCTHGREPRAEVFVQKRTVTRKLTGTMIWL